ncbi:hypothetical protein Tco_0866977 [Tanacetum coccineum]
MTSSYALSWKPCQGDSLNLPDHRIHKDGDGDASFQLKSDSLPHAHAHSTKTFYKHQDSRIMKAQELKQQSTHGQSNTSSNAPYWPIPTRNATLDDEEAQGKMGFALNLLTKLTQVSHHTDCHAGNPCELVNDPRVKICDPIIEEIQGPLLAGACNNHGV